MRAALVAAAALALVFAASASANIDASHTVQHAAVAGDCNGNGVPDLSEPAWYNRDDDGDGFCNGVDYCPYEATTTNADASACQMQAITVPESATNPNVPHPTYSGASITLKGIARYGGSYYKWDFGDGTSTSWTAIGNKYDLEAAHTYSGAVGRLFIGTLSVASDSSFTKVATASYPVEIMDSTASVPNDPAQLDVRARMAVDQALWYLHVNESRSSFGDGAPGYQQPYGFWNGGGQFTTPNCDAVDAFEQGGNLPQGNYDTDPYVEDVRRGLDYILYNTTPFTLQPFTGPYLGQLNADTNGNGIGLVFSNQQMTASGGCLKALADSGARTRIASTGNANVYGRSYADIAQDGVDYLAYGQDHLSSWQLGGWGYEPNDGYASDPGYLAYPVSGLAAAESKLGATIPPFVRQYLPYWLNASHYTAQSFYNGAWGYTTPTNYDIDSATGGGILGHIFLGDTAQQSDVRAGLGFLYRDWNDSGGGQWNCWGVNLGNTDSMYPVTLALTAAGASRVTEYDYTRGQQTSNSFDWYYTPAGQVQTGYATNLIQRQGANGSWSDSGGCGLTSALGVTALDTMILLSRQTSTTRPTASITAQPSADVNEPVRFDASGSSDPSGQTLKYEWDFHYDGVNFVPALVNGYDSTNPAVVYQPGYSFYDEDANGAPLAGVTPPVVCVRVTNTSGFSSVACTKVIVKPPPHAPAAVLAASISAAVDQPVQLDASGSFDVDNDPLTYAWDTHNDGNFADGTGSKLSYTFTSAGTYVVGVKVTDHPDQNTVPYNAPSESSTAYELVTVGTALPPVANAGGPYTVTPNAAATLDGSGSSDPTGDALVYAWDLNGDGVYGDSTSATPTFSVGNVAPGTSYTVCLKVTNTANLSATSCTTVKVIAAPQPPIAQIATPNIVQGGPLPVKVTLDGSRSYDVNGAALSYSWTVNDTTGGTTDDATSAIASHTFLHYGNYTAHLTVNNGFFSSSADATISILDRTGPTLNLPSSIVLEAGPTTTADVNNWLASATAFDDDPDHPGATISNDFAPGSGIGGVGVGNTVKVTWTAADDVNNTTQRSATVTVRDTTAPTLTLPGDQTANATSVNGATVSWTASAKDFVSGNVPVTCNPASGSTFPGGDTTVTCTATDGAGNTATGAFNVHVNADSTPPAITPTVTGTQGSDGWYTSDVHVSWSVTEDLSTITDETGCDPSSVTTDTTPSGVDITCSATSAGGTSSVTVHVKRDATAPTITASRTPDANGAGWSASDVTVTFTCADAGSGVASCSAPKTLGEGAGQSATGTVTDAAGNTATAALDKVNVDETAPTLSGAPTTPSNVNGWYSGDVTIAWTCDDALSGVAACPAGSVISGEGTGLTASAHVADRAGNTTDATSTPVNIDRTPPVTSVSAPTGWTDLGATVTFSALDNLSGVAVTYYSVDGAPRSFGDSLTIDSEGTHTITYWSVDNAGNVEATRTVTVLVDKSAPTIAAELTPAPNAAGWNNSDVSVGWACSDALSGVAFCSPVQLLTGEGQAQPVLGTATDNAGNTTQQTVLVSIDKTPPTISAAADRAPNAKGWYDADVTVSFTCADALAGIASCPAAKTLHEGKAQTASGTARDAAGNTAPASVSGVNVDETKPTVTYTGNAHTYSVAQTVAITCNAADALSGVDTTTCQNVDAPAWTLGLGTVSFSATATDRAGNVGAGSTSFTVGVTCASLKTLVGQFSSSASVTTSLQGKIDSICSAPNKNAKAGKLGAFDNAVDAQRGKALSSAEANELVFLAAEL